MDVTECIETAAAAEDVDFDISGRQYMRSKFYDLLC